ncbi:MULTISPECIES: thiamine phosphate synthase [unclassified Prevotella]|uniref:thiamine phosphate synthase n=1 Tax=unclassified Prevotella TaxID=2638335 RepID=UPI000CEA0138|nr:MULTISPECIES: thiamine phosphate synthase [unclassified Prevotella]MCX4292563.1 thiamine phosphate synthase [Prevotella sp.]NPD53602.1 thiamine phosphate synthase [Prevotella sp. PTAC]GAY27827.1 thiamine phosphate synthase [Prevotella sp. MGM1]
MKQLQFITHSNDRYTYADGARMALEGGCKWIQLRMKDATDDEVRQVAGIVQPLCREHEAVFLLDDRVGLAKELKADGVHLGRNDMPVDEARRILGEEFIIGGTANTFEDIERLWRLGADYIGCGPFRFTSTKKNLSPVLGLDGYRSIIGSMRAAGIELPVVAIGGITVDDIPAVMATGVDGIALSGAILNAGDPVRETARIMSL